MRLITLGKRSGFVYQMQSKRIQGNLHAVGQDYMVLKNTYDPNQLWLPFMDRTLFPAEPKTKVTPYKRHNFEKKTYAACSDEAKQIYHFERGVHQHTLPFREYKRVSHNQFRRLRLLDFPTWDRTEKGGLQTVIVREPRDAVIQWAHENLKGRFYVNTNELVCQFVNDALYAKMKFA